MQIRGSYFGAAFYTLAFVIAFFSGILSVAVTLAIAVYYAVGPTSMR